MKLAIQLSLEHTSPDATNLLNNLLNTWNVNLVRLPLEESFWLGSGGASYQANVDAAVAQVVAAGKYVLLDNHMYNEDWTTACTFWASCANHYKNNPNVLFGLYNEPLYTMTPVAQVTQSDYTATQTTATLTAPVTARYVMVFLAGNNDTLYNYYRPVEMQIFASGSQTPVNLSTGLIGIGKTAPGSSNLITSAASSDIPIERVYDLYVFGEMNYNTKLFTFLSQHKISVHMFNYYEFYTGSFCSRETAVSGNLLIKQINFYEDYQKRVVIAKEFILAAVDNIYRNLRYYNERGKDLTEYMDYIEAVKNSLQYAEKISEIMGYEGNIRKRYYEAWNIIINQDIDFTKRVRMPPDNMINTLISFCNSLIYTKILSEIYKTQINPTISYLHEPSTKRFSLALDISEVFKPLIVDRLIFSLLNKNMITESDFDDEMGNLRIKEKGIKTIVEEFENKLMTTIKHRTLNRDVSYKHLIRLEIYKLIKHLMDEQTYSGFRIWW